MPARLIRYFESRTLRQHLLFALCLGAILRSLSAFFSFGPMALDDYLHGMLPARQLSLGEPFLLPLWRSHLIVWILAAFMKVGRAIGGWNTSVADIRWASFCLGLVSLGTIVGGYFCVRNWTSAIAQALSLYMLAAFGVLPFVGTRGFGEALSMPFVMCGLGLCEMSRRPRANQWLFVAGAVLFCLSVLIRFQNFVLVAAYLGFLLFCDRKKALLAVAVGTPVLLGEVLVDKLSGKAPFETILSYLALNHGGGIDYGAQPWYVYVALLLACSYFPFSLSLLSKNWKWARGKGALLTCFLGFLIVHSFVAHKEDRYIIPDLGLFLLLLSALWAERARSRAARLVYFPAFVALNTVVLALSMFSNPQSADMGPLFKIQETTDHATVIETDTGIAANAPIRAAVTWKPIKFVRWQANPLSWEGLTKEVAENCSGAPCVVTARDGSTASTDLKQLALNPGWSSVCGEIQSSGSLTDRLIYYLNPARNPLRAPVNFTLCKG